MLLNSLLSYDVTEEHLFFQFLAHRFDHLGVFGVGEIHFARIHLENAAVVRSIHILGSQVEMQVAEFVGIGAVVDFLGLEKALHSACNVRYIGHEEVALLVAQFVQVVDMLVVRYQTAAMIGLLLK